MTSAPGESPDGDAGSIWAFAFGYFACYVPYSAMTKALTSGLLEGMSAPIPGVVILPVTVLSSLVGMFLFISAMGWWRYAGRRSIAGLAVPFPGPWTFLSGLCTAGIIATTTLAYTFEGISIVFMMLLMRGGVLVVAPIVDLVSRRRVRWFSWVALGLSFGALVTANLSESSLALTTVATADVVIYLAAYFVRLRFMSRLAKSDDPDATRRYFVEEQMTATPALVLLLVAYALLGTGSTAAELRAGFTSFLGSGHVLFAVVIGLLSQGTGIFGGLVLLDRRENTFCVPVNRASSILAGVAASASLYVLFAKAPPGGLELFGAALIVAAIVVLSVPSVFRRRAAG